MGRNRGTKEKEQKEMEKSEIIRVVEKVVFF
jgi:hypothetical protein